MHAAFLLLTLATAPDAFGELVLDADALYLAHRLVRAEPRAVAPETIAGDLWASTPEQLDAQACDVLFEDCSHFLDEFERKAAVARHQPELNALRKKAATLQTAVLGGSACLGEYDFKTESFPVTSFTLGSPGRASPTSPNGVYPFGFQPMPKRAPQKLRIPAAAAQALVKDTRCFDVRAEVVLPTKPVRWPATTRRVNPITHVAVISPAEPPDLVVELKRVRLIDSAGVDVATF